MAEVKIRRKYKSLPYTMGTSQSGSSIMRWDDAAGGSLLMGTASTSVLTIQVWASDTPEGTFGRLYTTSGAPADITLSASTTESRVYALPDEAYGVGAIKLVSPVAAGTAASCVIMIKT